MTDLLVAACDARAARYAVEHWHYSRTMPVGKTARFGAWEDGRFIGVVLFGLGASPHLGRALGLDPLQVCELTRVALTDHDTPVTQIVSRAIKTLKAANPGLRAVMSFADPNQGHHGGIYQGGNWLYLGTTAPAKGYLDANGKLLHQRVVTRSGYVRQFGRLTKAHRPDDLTPVDLLGKHRYLYPLDRALRRRLLPHTLPYPTR